MADDWKEKLKEAWKRLRYSAQHPFDYSLEEDPDVRTKFALLQEQIFAKLQEVKELPPDLRTALDPVPAMIGYLLAGAGGMGLSMLLSSVMSPMLAGLTYTMNKQFEPFRLDPAVVVTAWRRRFEPEFWDDLKDQGWEEDRIEAFKKAMEVMPTPADLTTWLAHEVFEPEMIERYGLDAEWEAVEKTEEEEHWFERIGMPIDVAKNYWRSHWVHPGLATVFTLLHRGEISEEEMYRYYRLVEISPYWRDKLTKISWDIPNRIELRMMTRYLGLGKDYITDMLEKVGLAPEYRSDVADFMIAMGVRTDLATRYRNRWITAEELKLEIDETGLSPVIADKLYKWIVKNEAPQRVEETRALTRALIVKGVKKEVIDRGAALELLMRHQNYAMPEAAFVLDVELGALGSPETPLEFKQLVEEYRASQGLEFKEIPSEAIEAEKALLGIVERLKQAREAKEEQEIIDQLNVQLASAQVRFDMLKAQYEL